VFFYYSIVLYACACTYFTFTRVYACIPNGHPRDDPRAEVGEDVRVGVSVRVRDGAVECQAASRGPSALGDVLVVSIE